MPANHFFAEDPREVGLDPAKVEALFVRAEREVKDGLLPFDSDRDRAQRQDRRDANCRQGGAGRC